MIDMRGVGTLIVMGLGSILAVLLLGIIGLVAIFVAVPGWVYVATAIVCLTASFVIGRFMERP